MGGKSLRPKCSTNPQRRRCQSKGGRQGELLYSFALLVSHCAGGLAGRLAGGLAVAAAALGSSRLEICLVDSSNVLQKEHLFLKM